MNVCGYTIREAVEKKQIDEILELFHHFRKNNIRIFARDGLLLGAIRHEGFLPFDADPDIGILAENYTDLNLNSDKYETIYSIGGRNLSYLYKTKIPYDFSINIKRKNRVIINIILILFLAVSIIFKKFILVIFILFLMFYNTLFLNGRKVLDGTIYPIRNGNYIQEIEKGEKKVFSKDYGHSEDENYFKLDRNDIFPLRQSTFYYGTISVPNKAEKMLLDRYGKDVFKVMYKKEDGDNIEKINIENCIAPPASIL
jgi:hypothetical protein